MNNVQRWSDTQLNDWERASLASEHSDDLPPRGRQTPFNFQDPVEEEEEEEEVEEEETESLPEDHQSVVHHDSVNERIDALRDELINKSSQVTFIYIALLTIQIVTKQLHNIKMGK